MQQLKLASVVLALLVLVACPNNPKPQTLPPGALNQFDRHHLYLTDGRSSGAQLAESRHRQTAARGQTRANKAIASYNLAEAAWQAYHAGKSNDQTALTNAVSQAVSDVATLLTQVSGGRK